MKHLRKLALGIVPALVLCTAPMAWSASAESGTAGDALAWTLEDDFLTITALDGSFTVTSDGEVLTISGTSYTHGIDVDNIDELGAALNFLMDNPASRYVIDVEEVNELVPVLSSYEMNVVLTEKVRYVAEDSLLMIPDYSIVTVQSPTLSLEGSGLGYDGSGEARVIGIRGYSGSPAEDYANSNEAFEFFSMDGSGQWDDDGLYTWEIRNDVLTISAADGSYQMTISADEVYVTGTAYTGLPSFGSDDDVYTVFGYLLTIVDIPKKLTFDVERIEDPEVYDIEVTELVLTDKVQSICEDGLYWVESYSNVYVESRTLELENTALGAAGMTIYGYADSPAQAYANANGITFVAFDEPEETTPPPSETTAETSASTEASTSATSSETSASTSNSTSATTGSTTETTSATTTAAENGADGGIALLSMPDTGDRNLPAIAFAGLAALVGGLFCMRKMK